MKVAMLEVTKYIDCLGEAIARCFDLQDLHYRNSGS